MFERFTDRARKVLALANQEAQILNHEYVGCEHLLLGLIKEGSGVGANVLKNLGVKLNTLRQEVTKIVAAGPDMVTMGRLPYTPRAKKVIEKSVEAARDLNHNYVGTEHLLLGLISPDSTDSVVGQVFSSLGITVENVKEGVNNLLGIAKQEEAKTASLNFMQKVEELAKRGHAGQKRSDGTDYINHPFSVRQRLINCGIRNNDVLATALLHDLLEDTTITEAEIEAVAGKTVLEAVKQLTNIVTTGTSFMDKTAQMLEHARHYGDIAKRVKIADRYDNLADAIWTWQPVRVKRYAQAGISLIDTMMPFPDDMFDFVIEARRFFGCLT